MDATTAHDCCAVSPPRRVTPDLVVIGADMIGGACVNIGCVPSKTLIRAAEATHHGKASARFVGVVAGTA